jgi:hypothetical protein
MLTANLIIVTPMLPEWISDLWKELPANSTDGVARAMLIPATRPDINGRTLWVAGNSAIELEEGLHDSQPQWIGEELWKAVDEGQKRMGIQLLFSNASRYIFIISQFMMDLFVPPLKHDKSILLLF